MASALFVTYERHQVCGNFNPAMRKSQKTSRTYSSEFAPEYSNGLETTGESVGARGRRSHSFGKSASFVGGFGASGRIDLEATPSEDSCTPKRKSINLNLEKNEGFSVPVHVYAVSVMSISERREFRKRLKTELEQVQALHRKIESGAFHTVTVSSSSEFCSGQRNSRLENVRSNGGLVKPSVQIPPAGCLNGKDKRTPKANQLYVNSEFVSGRDKCAQAEKPKTKGSLLSGVKRGLSGRFESRDEKRHKDASTVQPTKPDATLMKQCGTLLRRLMLHRFGWVFNSPVDVVKLNIPDYFNVIKKPMDLGTIKKKLDTEAYSGPLDFASDVRLTFANAMKYNPPGNDYHIMADALRKIFEDKWRGIEKKMAETDSKGNITQGIQFVPAPKHQLQPQQQQQYQNKTSDKPKQLSKAKPATASAERIPKTEPSVCPMTAEEKQKLSRDLEAMPGDMPEQIIDFLRMHSSDLTQNEDEIEVDIDAFDNETLLELRKIVTNCLNSKEQGAARIQPKVEPREAESLQPANVSRLSSNSPMCSRKGADPGDEDVDIGEDDLPASNFPPVEIEKDAAGRSSKCSSSSSSSSDSGSSSSDSDSASSSGSDSDVAKPPPETVHKETIGSGVASDQKGSPSMETHGAKRAVSELDEENGHMKPAPCATEPDIHQEGESAPAERQVSPDKLYRAALLRSRFADTILKAREKTLDQVDRGDPEKLRREREELERRQREEKARLQAEAKAAEMARKQAEAEAAAEAKRKREIEREAARMALQKMEKTVEIDENSQVLKDLEMLRSAQPDHIPSSADETSPAHSQDGLPPFTLQGRNPLEQLGLFMKVDEEDEEEANADCVDGNGDVEEGEID